MDKNKVVDLVYLYFQKAFDKESHERLMLKVNAHGIQGNAERWIRNWLAGHREWVCINLSNSNWAPITSGVPQGSVLGLLLFIIYINDQDTNIVSKMSKFADDTKLCHLHHGTYLTSWNSRKISLVEWPNKLQMSFNLDKCSVMHIGHNNTKVTITCPTKSCQQQINSRI